MDSESLYDYLRLSRPLSSIELSAISLRYRYGFSVEYISVNMGEFMTLAEVEDLFLDMDERLPFGNKAHELIKSDVSSEIEIIEVLRRTGVWKSLAFKYR